MDAFQHIQALLIEAQHSLTNLAQVQTGNSVWVAEVWGIDENGQPTQFSHLAGLSGARDGVARIATQANNEFQQRNSPQRIFLRPYSPAGPVEQI